jgi:hypothetical protein
MWQKMPLLVLLISYSYADRAHKSLSVMEPLINSDATLLIKRAADTKAVLKELSKLTVIRIAC